MNDDDRMLRLYNDLTAEIDRLRAELESALIVEAEKDAQLERLALWNSNQAARLAAVLALCDDPMGPNGQTLLFASDVRAAATGETK